MSYDSWEDQREAMYHASHQNKFYKEDPDSTTGIYLFSFEEFKNKLLERKPIYIYDISVSERDCEFYITRYNFSLMTYKMKNQNFDLTVSYETFYKVLSVSRKLTNIRY